MASIFEEMMTANRKLTESAIRRPRKSKKTEGRRINYKHVRVESRKFLEDADPAEIENDLAVAEEETPDEVVLVIDPQLDSDEVPEDAAAEMVGEDVYKCPVCGANYVCGCNEDGIYEDIVVDDEGVPVECPVCGDDSDQILIGTITPAGDAPGEETDLPEQEPEGSESDDDDEIIDDFSEEDFVEEESIKSRKPRPTSRKESTARKKPLIRKESKKKIRTEDKDLGSDIGEYQRWVDYDLKRYGKISDNTWNYLKKAKLTVDDENNVVTEGCLHEDDDMIADDVMVLDTPAECAGGDDTPDVVVTNSEVTLMLDETKLESMINRMMKENYKDAPRCKVTKVSSSGRTLKIEYVIRRNGKSVKGRLFGEGYDPSKGRFKIAFKNTGRTFAESTSRAPIMTVEFTKRGRSIIPTQMNYDYKVKVNESLYRVSGKVAGSPKK